VARSFVRVAGSRIAADVRRFSKRLVAAAVAEGQVQGRRAIVLGTREELAALGEEELLERLV